MLAVLSGKGGVGKTTLVANLGTAISHEFNKNVLIVDGNISTSHLGLHFGLYGKQPYTLEDLLKSNAPSFQSIYIHPASGVRILPAPLNSMNIDLKKLKKFAKELKRNYDFIIVDCAPGLGREIINVCTSIDGAVIVTTPDIPSVTDAMRSIDLLKRLNKNIEGIVVNRVNGKKYELTDVEIESACGTPVISSIPEDPKISESISMGNPCIICDGNSKASIAFKKLAAHLVGEEYEPPTFFEQVSKLFDFRRFFMPKEDGFSLQRRKRKLAAEVSDAEKLKTILNTELKAELRSRIRKRLKKRLNKVV